MKVTSNISQLIAEFQRIAVAATTLDVSAVLTIGVNTARAKMTNRIFNLGLDAEMVPFGKYTGKTSKITDRKYSSSDDISDSDDPFAKKAKKQGKQKLKRLQKNAAQHEQSQFTEYEKKRLAHGRQINYKDLEFTGGTRRSLKTQVNGDGVYAVFDNNENAKIMEYQEIQIGEIRGSGRAKIVALSEDERALLVSETNAALKQLYAGLFNS